MKNILSQIPNRYWAYLTFLIWGASCLMLLHKTPYGIDEGAAQALLLVWSVADNVVSPIVTLGLPDFRTVFLAPAGILWTGNVLAAKVTTMVVMSIAAWAFYGWRQRSGETESALIGTGLLLISPMVLMQIDTISVGAYLLAAFVLGAWADLAYRESNRAFSGTYFAQIFLCVFCVTLHPAGLAYPLALLWTWHKNPTDKSHRNYFFGGVAFALVIALILTSGWNHIDWFSNPVRSLSDLILGPTQGDEFGALRWTAGVAMAILLLTIVLKEAARLWADFLGRTLLLALVIGLLAGDDTFAFIALATCLYWGLPLLLRNSGNANGGFAAQRGMVLTITVIIAITFMTIDKAHYLAMQAGTLSPRDTLIKLLAEDSGLFLNDESDHKPAKKKQIRVASQWPGLTMLACRCDALPLPPNAKDSEALWAMLRGVDFLMFDPRTPANSSLAHNLANMNAGKVETVALQAGGVIVQVLPAPPNQPPDKKK
jgi:hypothetical protein